MRPGYNDPSIVVVEAKILALGICATCYTLKRKDEAYFGGLREAVLERESER